eukprot:11194597-Lingulodinium_polyedra.AAC.1
MCLHGTLPRALGDQVERGAFPTKPFPKGFLSRDREPGSEVAAAPGRQHRPRKGRRTTPAARRQIAVGE